MHKILIARGVCGSFVNTGFRASRSAVSALHYCGRDLLATKSLLEFISNLHGRIVKAFQGFFDVAIVDSIHATCRRPG
jgi:hypothetical protein